MKRLLESCPVQRKKPRLTGALGTAHLPNSESARPSSDKVAAFRFFDLPAELRLAIFDFAAAVSPLVIRLKKLKAPSSDRTRGLYDCFSLLHANRRLRSEFTETYYRYVHFAVDKEYARDLLHDIHNAGGNAKQMTILVDLTPKMIDGVWNYESARRNLRTFPRDVLPVLDLKFNTFPECSFTVAELRNTDAPLEDRLQPLSGIALTAMEMLLGGNKAWKKALKSDIDQVHIEARHARIRIVYKVYHEEPWMRTMLGNNELMSKYLTSRGLSVPMVDGHPVLRVHFGVRY